MRGKRKEGEGEGKEDGGRVREGRKLGGGEKTGEKRGWEGRG